MKEKRTTTGKRIYSIVVTLVLFLICCHGYKNLLSQGMVVGIYENYNFNPDHPALETPNKEDKLILREDNTFENGYWGKGTYELEYFFTGTEIKFSYSEVIPKDTSLSRMEDVTISVGYQTAITRINFGEPGILLNREINHYYRKLLK